MLIEHAKLTPGLIPRTYLIVDLDNICAGCSNTSPSTVTFMAKNLLAGLANAGIDLRNLMTTIATGVETIYRNPLSAMSWPNSPRLLQGRGVDGADERILDVLNNDPALRRSRTVVIASGDHIYNDSVDDLNELGIETICASYPGSLSAKLKTACKFNIEIPKLSSVEGDWIA